jgi:hypothetical protein
MSSARRQVLTAEGRKAEPGEDIKDVIVAAFKREMNFQRQRGFRGMGDG